MIKAPYFAAVEVHLGASPRTSKRAAPTAEAGRIRMKWLGSVGKIAVRLCRGGGRAASRGGDQTLGGY